MIVSKPKKQALFALAVFTILTLSLGSYNLYRILNGIPWLFNYIMASIFLPIGLILLIRLLVNYKIISIGQEKVQVWYPVRFSTFRMPTSKLNHWQETIIQTKTGVYKQLEIVFPGKTIKMTIQENTQYQETVNYFKQKLARKRKK